MSTPSGTPSALGRVIVDASVAIQWFVPEIHADAARRLLREGMTLLAPDLIWAEVANALWRKWREKELGAEAVEGILTTFAATRCASTPANHSMTWRGRWPRAAAGRSTTASTWPWP